jgi:hypothetical protein
VPSAYAVLGMNWIRPAAPLPAAFRTDGLNVRADSKAMQAIK